MGAHPSSRRSQRPGSCSMFTCAACSAHKEGNDVEENVGQQEERSAPEEPVAREGSADDAATSSGPESAPVRLGPDGQPLPKKRRRGRRGGKRHKKPARPGVAATADGDAEDEASSDPSGEGPAKPAPRPRQPQQQR